MFRWFLGLLNGSGNFGVCFVLWVAVISLVCCCSVIVGLLLFDLVVAFWGRFQSGVFLVHLGGRMAFVFSSWCQFHGIFGVLLCHCFGLLGFSYCVHGLFHGRQLCLIVA